MALDTTEADVNDPEECMHHVHQHLSPTPASLHQHRAFQTVVRGRRTQRPPLGDAARTPITYTQPP